MGADMRLAGLSVVVTCQDQADRLEETVASVRVQQTRPMDILVVDDGSLDDTASVAGRLRVRCFHQNARGRWAALSAGLSLAHGEYVQFLAAGDRLLPDALARNLALLDTAPDAAFAAGALHPAGLAAILFRRRLLLAAGGLPADADSLDDQTAAARLCVGLPRLHHDAAIALPGPPAPPRQAPLLAQSVWDESPIPPPAYQRPLS